MSRKQQKTDPTASKKKPAPADRIAKSGELDEEALGKVSGGTLPCATGKHIPDGQIKV